MRRIVVLTTLVAAVAAALAAWSGAAPSAGERGVKASTGQALPRLPAEVKNRGRWIIGVKCDFPPFGYLDSKGRNRGYDVEVARSFARYAFGSKSRVSFECVTTPSRIPALQSKRVDIIISTLTYTRARAEVIAYSLPYYGATGRLLLPNNSSIRRLSDLSGKTVATTRGSIYDSWLSNCFKNTQVVLTDTTTNSLLALKQGRADTFMFDDAFLVGVAANDSTLKLGTPKFLEIPWGIGIRKGEAGMKAWVDSRIRLMRKRDQFWLIMRRTIPRSFFTIFKRNVPRPKVILKYPTGDAEKVCPS